jgi:ERCC4-type nuclease
MGKNFMSGHPSNYKFIYHFEKLRQDALGCNNLNLAHNFGQVVISLRKYPIALTSITQAEALQGVGSSHILEFQRLIQQGDSNCDVTSWFRHVTNRVQEFAYQCGGFPLLIDVGSTGPVDPFVKKKTPTYSPTVGSTPWACLVVLHLLSRTHSHGIDVSQIYTELEKLKPLYPKAAKMNDTTLKKLVQHDLIHTVKSSEEIKLTLARGCLVSSNYSVVVTDKGKDICCAIWQRALRSHDLNAVFNVKLTERPEAESAPKRLDALPLRSWADLVMLVDSREFSLMNVLLSFASGIVIEQRPLPVSDIIWVWRCKKSKEEHISGYVVERKAIEDLSTSIKDGRYEEQRRRLSRAPGVTEVIYVVEGAYEDAARRHPSVLPRQTIETAIRHTKLSEGFSVLEVQSIEETAELLIEMHARIQSLGFEFEGSEDVPTFRDFNADCQKTSTMTIAQVSSRILRSVPGVGNEAIIACNDYLYRIGKGGLTLGNLSSILSDPLINETIKQITGVKRVPFNSTALEGLREQYMEQ